MKTRPAVAVYGAILALGTSAAFATPFTLTGNYSVTDAITSGGPGITKHLHDPFTVSLTPGTETVLQEFFTASPNQYCRGAGCDRSTNTETDGLTASFWNLHIAGIGSLGDLTGSGTFIAKYSGTELPCAVGDGVRDSSSGKSDCVLWGSTTTYNGSTMLSENIGHGYDLDIYLYNSTDWNITPRIGFELVPDSVPEPATLALLAAGLAALGWSVSRRRKAS